MYRLHGSSVRYILGGSPVEIAVSVSIGRAFTSIIPRRWTVVALSVKSEFLTLEIEAQKFLSPTTAVKRDNICLLTIFNFQIFSLSSSLKMFILFYLF